MFLFSCLLTVTAEERKKTKYVRLQVSEREGNVASQTDSFTLLLTTLA